MGAWVWKSFKANVHEFCVIIVHLKIMAINSLVISNWLDFHYEVSRVKEVLLWLGFSRSLGRLSLTEISLRFRDWKVQDEICLDTMPVDWETSAFKDI